MELKELDKDILNFISIKFTQMEDIDMNEYYIDNYYADYIKNGKIYMLINYRSKKPSLKEFFTTKNGTLVSMGFVIVKTLEMNYTQTKDLCVSRFIDFSNENASPCFCFKSVCVPQTDYIFKNI
jgi:hypothetical protein